MKTPTALFVWVLCVLLLATSAGARAADAKQDVLGPYRSAALAQAAARRLGHHGWSTHVSGRRRWYVQVKWADGVKEGPVHRGASVSAVQSRGKDSKHDVQTLVMGTKQEFILKAEAVSNLQDGDWQINAGRVRHWAEGGTAATRLKRPTRLFRSPVSR